MTTTSPIDGAAGGRRRALGNQANSRNRGSNLTSQKWRIREGRGFYCLLRNPAHIRANRVDSPGRDFSDLGRGMQSESTALPWSGIHLLLDLLKEVAAEFHPLAFGPLIVVLLEHLVGGVHPIGDDLQRDAGPKMVRDRPAS